MLSDNVIFFPFESYHRLLSEARKDRKDEYLFDVFRLSFFNHRPVIYDLEYIGDEESIHHASVLIGLERCELITFVSHTFKGVFTTLDRNELGVSVQPLSFVSSIFSRDVLVEIPRDTIDIAEIEDHIARWAHIFFPDWDEGMIYGGSSKYKPRKILRNLPISQGFWVETLVIKGYSKEMLTHVISDGEYDLQEVTQHRLVFRVTLQGQNQWDAKFPNSRGDS